MNQKSVLALALVLSFFITVGITSLTGTSGVAQNPWEKETINVTITDNTQIDRNWEPLMIDSLNYWNRNMSRVGFSGEFQYVDSERHADVNIIAVKTLNYCNGIEGDVLGCAPVYTSVGEATEDKPTPSGLENVIIAGTLKNNVTNTLLKHELGHTIGVRHSDIGEYPVMQPRFASPKRSVPNASTVVNPWEKDTLNIYYNTTNADRDDIIKFEIARSYYNTETTYTPSNITLSRTENPEQADIEIRISDRVAAGKSKWSYRGYDSDLDGSIETFTNGVVYISPTVSTENLAWHTGSGIGRLFGTESSSDLPAPFDDSMTTNPREWTPTPSIYEQTNT